ncbi:MAG: TetR family transcriptional regulator [Modestobacter sp.]|nr:TetR family transcriptional regulator [Modestobacter sp.]
MRIDDQRTSRGQGSHDAGSVTGVAFRLFRARGYEATSVDQIARELGVTKAAIYHHLAGKEAILAAGINRAIQALTGVLQEAPALPGAGAPLERFEYILRRTLEIGLEHLDEVTVLLRLRGNTELEREMLDRRRAFDRAVAEVMREAVDAGDLPADTDALLMTRLIMGMNNWLTEWYQPGGALSAAAVIDTVTRFAMAGLTAPGRSDR